MSISGDDRTRCWIWVSYSVHESAGMTESGDVTPYQWLVTKYRLELLGNPCFINRHLKDHAPTRRWLDYCRRPRHLSYHTLQHAATTHPRLWRPFSAGHRLQLTAMECNNISQASAHLENEGIHRPSRHCNTLQHAATHCNTLQHAATHYNNTPQALAYSVKEGIQGPSMLTTGSTVCVCVLSSKSCSCPFFFSWCVCIVCLHACVCVHAVVCVAHCVRVCVCVCVRERECVCG